MTRPRVNYAYPFDAAIGSGPYAVVYKRLGTKGLVLRNGEILREINRSFYHAEAYEYPICLARLASSRNVLIHCPEEYCRLEICDLDTGASLTLEDTRSPADFFHSRLVTDPSGAYLLSAGWIWHPFDSISLYRIEDALTNPRSLDGSGLWGPTATAISSAAFIDQDRIVLAASGESFADEEDLASPDLLRPNSLAVWSRADAKIVAQSPIAETAGTLMAIDSSFVVGFYEHPKVFAIDTGEVVARLPAVDSGRQASSIIHHIDPPPPLALDPLNRRFAIASRDEILVAVIE